MRRNAKVDRNQPAIVTALRRAGATVQPLHTIGQGCPDLLVGYRQRNILIEVKDQNQPPSKQKLTPDQQHWIGTWRAPVYVVRNPVEAVGLLNMVTK